MTVKEWLELIGAEHLEKLMAERAGMPLWLPTMKSWDRYKRNQRICSLYALTENWEEVGRQFPEVSLRQLQRIWTESQN